MFLEYIRGFLNAFLFSCILIVGAVLTKICDLILIGIFYIPMRLYFKLGNKDVSYK